MLRHAVRAVDSPPPACARRGQFTASCTVRGVAQPIYSPRASLHAHSPRRPSTVTRTSGSVPDGAQHDAPAAAQLRSTSLERPLHRVAATSAAPPRARTLTVICGTRAIPRRACAERLPRARSTSSTSSALTMPSPVLARSRHRMWPDVSPPSTPPCAFSMLQHVAVADVGAQELHAELGHRALDAEVRHQRADHRAAQHDRAVSHRAPGCRAGRRRRPARRARRPSARDRRRRRTRCRDRRRARARPPAAPADAWRRTSWLMLRPSGLPPIAMTSAPSSANTLGRDLVRRAVRAVEHDAQSAQIESSGTVALQNSRSARRHHRCARPCRCASTP